ncbi:MAG: carboxypeptidase regulatory-like domain-containing protein [Candidatus Aenigmatarchaeota archaeon]
MKKAILFAFVIGILILPIPALASPTINEIVFSPSPDIWVDESLLIKVNCSEGENVSAKLVGSSGYIIYAENFTRSDEIYSAKIDSTYWRNKADAFTAIINCSKGNESDQKTANFNVSKFVTSITNISPTTIYLGDMIEIGILVKKNEQPINSSDVKFNITLDALPIKPEIRPPYDPNIGWLIFLNSSEIADPIKTHNLRIFVSYDRVNATETTSFVIQEPIQFSIISVDKTWVKPNETINLKIQAFDRGIIIPLNMENLAVQIGSTQATIATISPSGNYYNIAIIAPSLSSGSYNLVATLSHNNYSYTSSRPIDYIVPISGRITDENDKGVSTRISFYSGGTEKLRLYTDSAGTYSGNLPPGTYDVEFVFPQSTLRLYDVEINRFEDPVKYYYFGSADVPGLNVVGLFVYETDLRYYKASIEMKYSESNVLNENLLKVYKCEDWNSGKKECYGRWNEIGASIDVIRNMVYVNTSSLSAYAIGTEEKLSVDFNLNKEIFYLKDLVKLRGMVIDEQRNPVSNATITLQIKNTSIKERVFSDSNGLFTIEFLSPEKEGNYSLILSAEKHPYISFNSTLTLQVVKSKEISIVFPDTIRINQGENFTQDFSVVNIGQAELHDLKIFIEGIPNEYYILQDGIEKLEVNEEKKLKIEFFVPANASAGTLSCKLRVFNEEVSKEKIFGFTIIEKNQTLTQRVTPVGFFGKIVLPQIAPDWIYILLFAAIAFSLAFLLKKRKIKSQDREEIKNFLSDVKEYLKKKEEKAESTQAQNLKVSTETEEEILEEEKGIG